MDCIITTYTYNTDNRITDANYNYGTSNTVKVHWSYDGDGRVTSRDVYDDNTTQIFNTTTTYTENTYATAYIQTIRNRQIGSSGYDKTLTYEYDNNNNITKINDGTNETTYIYDKKQQLIRENNQAAGKTWTWDYDDGGNITYKKEYAYTTSTLGTPLLTIPYIYADTRGWTDMLTSYDGNTITYDDSGNPLSDGTWTYTWEAGRNLVGMSKTGRTIAYTYNRDGIRTNKVITYANNVTTTYNYTLIGDKVATESNGTDTIIYRYDGNDKLISMNLNGRNTITSVMLKMT
jgi:YD repeat-containing protein